MKKKDEVFYDQYGRAVPVTVLGGMRFVRYDLLDDVDTHEVLDEPQSSQDADDKGWED